MVAVNLREVEFAKMTAKGSRTLIGKRKARYLLARVYPNGNLGDGANEECEKHRLAQQNILVREVLTAKNSQSQ
jgi:hypothetical protein